MTLLRCLFATVLLVGTACNQDRIARLEKQNQELAARLETTAKAANLDMQAKCAQAARIAFNESGLKKEALAGYTNHYNQTLNRCFVKFSTFKAEGKGSTIYKSVLDAFEGNQYGEYYWSNSQNKPAWEVKPMVCTVTLSSGEEKHCESDKEFEDLLKVYMER